MNSYLPVCSDFPKNKRLVCILFMFNVLIFSRSRSRSGDSVSAMSGISSASTSDTLGPLPTEGAGGGATGKPAGQKSESSAAVPPRKSSMMAIPDICQMSPPAVQFSMPHSTAQGFGPGHRRRTSSSSSCGTPPPNMQWQISPGSPSGTLPTISLIRCGEFYYKV